MCECVCRAESVGCVWLYVDVGGYVCVSVCRVCASVYVGVCVGCVCLDMLVCGCHVSVHRQRFTGLRSYSTSFDLCLFL